MSVTWLSSVKSWAAVLASATTVFASGAAAGGIVMAWTSFAKLVRETAN